MKSINQQLRAIKEAQEIQEGKVKAEEKPLADNWGVLTAANATITRIQKPQEDQSVQYDALFLNINAQAKPLETFQTDMNSFRTKKATDIQDVKTEIQDLKAMLQNISNNIMHNQNIPQPQPQPHMIQNLTNNMMPQQQDIHQSQYQGYIQNPHSTTQFQQQGGFHPSMQGQDIQYQSTQMHGLQPKQIQFNNIRNVYMNGGHGHDNHHLPPKLMPTIPTTNKQELNLLRRSRSRPSLRTLLTWLVTP